MLAKWPPKDELKEGWPEGRGLYRAPSLRQEELRMPSRHPQVLMTRYHRYINQLSVSAENRSPAEHRHGLIQL